MSYSVNPKLYRSTFSVPTEIADEHLKMASKDQLTVLLWILRNSPDSADLYEMSEKLNIDPRDAIDYLEYWLDKGVLASDGKLREKKPEPDYVPSSHIAQTVKADAKPEPATEIKTVAEADFEPSKPSSAEIATRLDESPEIAHLFNEAQSKLGKTIGYDGQCTLLLLHDHYGLPASVLFMLIEYCVSVGKTNYAYIKAVGKDWGMREVDTVEKAAEQIQSLNSINRIWRILATNAGLTNQRPTTKNVPYIKRWITDFKFNEEMIIYAYEETVNNTGKFQIKYTDTVLKSWFDAGYKTPDDVEKGRLARTENAAQKPAKTVKTKQPERTASYDLDEFEERSLHGALKYRKKNKE